MSGKSLKWAGSPGSSNEPCALHNETRPAHMLKCTNHRAASSRELSPQPMSGRIVWLSPARGPSSRACYAGIPGAGLHCAAVSCPDAWWSDGGIVGKLCRRLVYKCDVTQYALCPAAARGAKCWAGGAAPVTAATIAASPLPHHSPRLPLCAGRLYGSGSRPPHSPAPRPHSIPRPPRRPRPTWPQLGPSARPSTRRPRNQCPGRLLHEDM